MPKIDIDIEYKYRKEVERARIDLITAAKYIGKIENTINLPYEKKLQKIFSICWQLGVSFKNLEEFRSVE